MKKHHAIDLADLDTSAACDKPVEVELKHPATHAPLGIFISIIGKDSSTFRDYIRESVNDNLRKQFSGKKDTDIPTVEKGEEKAVEAVTVCTVGWRTGDEKTLTFKGEVLPFNVANAKKVYEALPWIRQQVDEAIGNLSLFMPG